MLDRATEERHLRLADEHIHHAQDLIRRLQEIVEHARSCNGDVEQAVHSLAAMNDVLATFVAHRNTILQTISDIDAGKL